MIRIALAGNQNCGKTTLFNQLTGSNQHVGNFPGVTVEQKKGIVRGHSGITVVDLPGIYSLSPYTSEEVVARDYLVHQRPDVIVNIIDASNIERNLYLTLQLLPLGIPLVIALNMMDEIRSNGGVIDIPALEKELGVFVVPIVANKNEGISELVERIQTVAGGESSSESTWSRRIDFCSGPVHKALHSISHLIEIPAREAGYEPRFAATKLIEGDPLLETDLQLSSADRDIIKRIVREMETDLGTDREAAIADMRYAYIERLVSDTVKKKQESREQVRSIKLDSVLTHRIFALPIFAVLMIAIFWITFGPPGSFVSDLFGEGIDILTENSSRLLRSAGVSPWMHSLIVDGALQGVGSVLSFLPLIVILFFFLSLLEDTGYMARVAFVLDSLLRKIGLSGRSFVPMLIGFGCTVPAIMATRTLSSERDRKMTILLTPFMSCTAKVPVYIAFCAVFFPENTALVMGILYLAGIMTAIVFGLVFKKTLFRGNSVPFVLELPVYRLPTPKMVFFHLWDKVHDFIARAFTIIFIGSLIIWFLTNLNWAFHMVESGSDSILASLGSVMAPVFTLTGFSSWQAVAALVSGFAAKEAVISTLSVVLPTGIGEYFTPLSAVSFMVFILLYTPCVAAIAAIRREMGSLAWTAGAVVFQLLTAWGASVMVFQVGHFLGF